MFFSLPSEAFQYDEAKDVNAKEFFSLYRDHFPMMAVVTEGYYGDTPYDSYDTSQVFRIHGYTSQPRVVALDSSEARTQSHKYLTIPIETPVKFRVVKGHQTVGDIQQLETIMEQNSLPVLIQPACDKKYQVKVWGNRGYDWKMMGDFGNLLITKRFEERFMMIQCLVTQTLNICEHVNLLALTPDITMAAITGFTKGTGTQEEFQTYMKKLATITGEEMKKKNKNHSYDMKRGNPDWGYCFLSTVSLATGSGGEASEYAPLVPFEEVFPDTGPPPPVPPRTDKATGLEAADQAEVIYEEIDPDNIFDDTATTAKVKPDSVKQVKTYIKTEPKRSHRNKGREFAHLEESIKRRIENQTQAGSHFKISSRENDQLDTKKAETTGNIEANTEKLQYTKDSRKGKMTNDFDNEPESRYVHLKQSGQGSGYLKVIHDGVKVGHSQDSKTSSETKTRDTKEKLQSENASKELTKQDVAKMTIAEIGESLKALQLDKHVKTFKEQMIDGAIVQDLTMDDFVKEFKLTKLEALRLAKFISTGHIPK